MATTLVGVTRATPVVVDLIVEKRRTMKHQNWSRTMSDTLKKCAAWWAKKAGALQGENESLRAKVKVQGPMIDDLLSELREKRELIVGLRDRVAELEDENERFRKGKHFVEKRRLEARVAELEDSLHYTNGGFDLAIKHRNEAEKRLDAVRALPVERVQVYQHHPFNPTTSTRRVVDADKLEEALKEKE